jgi:tight adherence protein B
MNAMLIPILAGIAVNVALIATALRIASSARVLNEAVERVVDRDLADAFIFLDGRSLLRATALTAAFLAIVAFVLDVGVVGCVILGASIIALPRLTVTALRARRQRRLVSQLPDAIQALAALLRAGHSLAQAATTLADTQPRPLRDEWRLLVRRLRMGERADVVFESLANRIAAPEAHLFSTTVRIAVDLGGSLAEALENLAGATRKRLEMQARIGALTSQGRLQGVIVGALPLLLMMALAVMDGEAMQLLWTRPAGWAALGLICCLEICGFVMIRRIVRIDV